jgi:hypothetical protein
MSTNSSNLYTDTITIDTTDTLELDNMMSTLGTFDNSLSINSNVLANGYYPANNYGNYTITTTNNTSGHGPIITSSTGDSAALEVKGDANFEGDIKLKGKSLSEFLSKIEDRLAILQPDPKKLEKYESLRKAYENYKLMEKLIGED